MKTKSGKAAKRTSWAVTIFYFLIAFEFFYMASPFAIYFYSVYRPGLVTLNKLPFISWVTQFFLPHIVEDTKSPIINTLGNVGGIIAVLGLLIFFICASQVYYKKLFKKGVVTGGLYKIIRHPQYTGFALSSFGMLLIWPRYLVLITFITILFVYYFLAKTEEKECEDKFGKSYINYKNKTFMFLPFRILFFKYLFGESINKSKKVLIYVTFYIFSVILSVILANGIRSLSVDSLYVTYDNQTVCLSIMKNDTMQIRKIMSIAYSDHKIDSIMKAVKQQSDLSFVNYILPEGIYQISEIPMFIPADMDSIFNELEYDGNKVKVVFTKANLNTDKKVRGKDILLHTRSTTPIIEVWIDISAGKVLKLIFPTKVQRYENIPVPVF